MNVVYISIDTYAQGRAMFGFLTTASSFTRLSRANKTLPPPPPPHEYSVKVPLFFLFSLSSTTLYLPFPSENRSPYTFAAKKLFKEIPMMKKSTLLGLFSLGFLAVLLAGCFNPVEAIPAKQDDPIIDSVIEPFTYDILIGGDGRSIAGPDAARIQGDIRNIVQLIVVDDSGKIVAFEEVRRKSDTERDATLTVDTLPFDHTYHFLLLMGHWERDYLPGNGDYQYTADPPTLLAAGLKEQHITGSGKITVTMWPIVVDMAFTSGNLTKAPEVTAGKPGKVILHPTAWNVTWTIKKGLTGNGLTDLVKAQNIIADTGETLRLKSRQTLVREGGEAAWVAAESADLSGNVITQSIGAYTSGFRRVGKEGAVNFKLEYVPFNLTDGNLWTSYDEDSGFDLNGKPPVWVIRNGVNDETQTDATDFTAFHNIGNNGMGAANGNGAVRYGIAAKTPGDGDGGGSTLVIGDGKFLGPANSDTPDISFTTDGYDGTAEVWYAVVPKGDTPGYSDYSKLDDVGTGEHQETITLEPNPAGGDYDVYVIVYKDGAVSEPIVINTKKGAGGVDWIWGGAPYKNYYVASYGNDTDAGTKTAPLATVQKALTNLAAAYAADGFWPEKGTEQESPGGIIILDTVNVTQSIAISGTGYPAIILCDDPENPGGKLESTSNSRLLTLGNGARVTLEGALVLAGIGTSGVYVEKSVFTMNGGVISGHSSSHGGGVTLNTDSTFIMNGGEISNNRATMQGGGVWLNSYNNRFIMNGGKISNNISDGSSGGVDIHEGSTFIMNDGEISNNTAADGSGGGLTSVGTFTMSRGKISGNIARSAGGVYNCGTFTMTGGEISGNMTTGSQAGGGGIYGRGDFTMTGGVISGNSSERGGGVYIQMGSFTMKGGVISGNSVSTYFFGGGGVFSEQGGVFNKTGGIIYGYDAADTVNSNVAKDSYGVIVSNKGHAVYCVSTYRKETTVGPNDNLTYNYPNTGDYTGW
jgi:hypothetical protein